MIKKLLLVTMIALTLAGVGASAFPAQAAAALEDQALTAGTMSLSQADTQSLLFMYEEEKLARDVYNSLYTLWNQVIFQNIARSEQLHMDAVATLLVRYGIAVPQTTAGKFNDPALQSLYNALMTTGRKSLAEALKVGATIEEVDITDLQTHLAKTTSPDIQQVYNNLMNGSFNHLRNFVNVLERLTGETYQPQYLTATAYQEIVSGSNGRASRGYRSGR